MSSVKVQLMSFNAELNLILVSLEDQLHGHNFTDTSRFYPSICQYQELWIS